MKKKKCRRAAMEVKMSLSMQYLIPENKDISIKPRTKEIRFEESGIYEKKQKECRNITFWERVKYLPNVLKILQIPSNKFGA